MSPLPSVTHNGPPTRTVWAVHASTDRQAKETFRRIFRWCRDYISRAIGGRLFASPQGISPSAPVYREYFLRSTQPKFRDALPSRAPAPRKLLRSCPPARDSRHTWGGHSGIRAAASKLYERN